MAETSRFKIPELAGTELVSEGPTRINSALVKVDENLMDGSQDFLQAGVVSSTDWSFTAAIVGATGELESSAEVAESLAWVPDPTESKKLMRTKTAKGAIAKKALASGSLPGVGKFSCVAFELTGVHWDEAATVTTKAGTEQTTQALAEANPPATTAGKVQVKQVIVEAKAGPTYAIVGTQKDVRPFAANRTITSAKSIIATEQSTSSASPVALTTPDVVTVTMPENGLLAIAYYAAWKQSAEAKMVAGLYINGTIAGTGSTNVTGAGVGQFTELQSQVSLTTGAVTLVSVTNLSGATGYVEPTIERVNPITYFAPTGLCTVMVKFSQTGGGTVSVKDRKLWAWVIA